MKEWTERSFVPVEFRGGRGVSKGDKGKGGRGKESRGGGVGARGKKKWERGYRSGDRGRPVRLTLCSAAPVCFSPSPSFPGRG